MACLENLSSGKEEVDRIYRLVYCCLDPREDVRLEQESRRILNATFSQLSSRLVKQLTWECYQDTPTSTKSDATQRERQALRRDLLQRLLLLNGRTEETVGAHLFKFDEPWLFNLQSEVLVEGSDEAKDQALIRDREVKHSLVRHMYECLSHVIELKKE